MWFWLVLTVVTVIGIVKLAERRQIRERYENLQEAVFLSFNLINDAKRDLPAAQAEVLRVQREYSPSVILSYKCKIWYDLTGIEDLDGSGLPSLEGWPDSLSGVKAELDRLAREGSTILHIPVESFIKENHQRIWTLYHQWNDAIFKAHQQISWALELPLEIATAASQAQSGWHERVEPLIKEVIDLLEQKKDVFVPQFIRLCTQRLEDQQHRNEWLSTTSLDERRDWIAANQAVKSSIFTLGALKESLSYWKKINEEDLHHIVKLGIV